MNKETVSSIHFNDFMQWLSKNDMVQLNSYKLNALVTYETDNEDLNLCDNEMKFQVSTDSQKGGSIFLFELDADTYFTEFIVKWQDFIFNERKGILEIKGCNKTNEKDFSKYTITIRHMQKLN